MGTPSLALHSSRTPLIYHFNPRIAARHFNKQLVCTPPSSISLVKLSTFSNASLNSDKLRRAHLIRPFKCSVAENPSSNFGFEPQILLEKAKELSFSSVKDTVINLTPVGVCKWLGIAAIVVAAIKWTVNLMWNPFFWMYFSWTWCFWPWFVAIGVGLYGVYCFTRHLRGKARVFEQLAIVTATFTWFILVPPGFFNGFLEGWPFVFCFIYHYFFFFNVSIRKRLYGDYDMRPHDPKWDVSVPKWCQALFAGAVMVGHWLAAFEGPELHLIPGGWSNVGIWVLIMITLFTQYHGSLYLAKYSEKVVVPTNVVQFGPYRWVRHPIYASTMLLFFTYFVALRAPLSCLYIVAVCTLYYDKKAKLEEALMVDTFGQMYLDYVNKVKYKLIPFVY